VTGRALLEARSPAAFHERPAGGFVAGASWFYFAFDETLFGYAIWGRPEAEDIAKLVRVLVSELDRPPHAALVDFAHLESVAPAAFDALAAYATTHEQTLGRIVTQTAIVRPGTPVNAAIVTGFFDVSSRPFPVAFFEGVEPALVHLGRADAKELAEALREVRARVSDEPEVLRELRAHLGATVRKPSLDDAARALGLSARTLQRRLADVSTSFEAEVQHVRIVLAQRMLGDTDVPVTTIALDLGFQTAQHFSTLFRSRTGETPSAYRARSRGLAR
jgi:AraC-like DNA-binding protein